MNRTIPAPRTDEVESRPTLVEEHEVLYRAVRELGRFAAVLEAAQECSR